MKYVYTFDYQMNGPSRALGWGDIQIEQSSRMTAADLKQARAEILRRAQQDWMRSQQGRLMRGNCPVRSVAILNIWESEA